MLADPSDVLAARIRANEWRLFGMASGLLVGVLATYLGSIDRTFAPLAMVGFLGLPVALVSGWMFAPLVVAAPWRWLLPVVVGTAVAAAMLGWLGLSAVVVVGGLTLAAPSGGASLFAGLVIAVAGLPFVAPALLVILPIVAVWAALIRAYAAWRRPSVT
jgi:hypothetical protein